MGFFSNILEKLGMGTSCCTVIVAAPSRRHQQHAPEVVNPIAVVDVWHNWNSVLRRIRRN